MQDFQTGISAIRGAAIASGLAGDHHTDDEVVKRVCAVLREEDPFDGDEKKAANAAKRKADIRVKDLEDGEGITSTDNLLTNSITED